MKNYTSKQINEMSYEDRMKRLDAIQTEIFHMANSFAGNHQDYPGIATNLHKSANYMLRAMKIFSGDASCEGISVSDVMSACGFPSAVHEEKKWMVEANHPMFRYITKDFNTFGEAARCEVELTEQGYEVTVFERK